MAFETSLKQLCTPAVLSRARRLAARGEHVHARRCRHDGLQTVLNAKVDASSSWDGPHRPSVVIDEETGSVVDYGCDCVASRSQAGPCKHAVALVIDFGERPERYEGYDAVGRVSTSRSVARLMERASAHLPTMAGPSTEEGPGTVGIELTLAYEAGFSARFRLLGSQGAYVVKSIADFVSDVEAGAFRAYGKRLAFAHRPDAFSPRGREVAEFLLRAVRNRRAYAFERVVGHALPGAVGAPGRELHLSGPELCDLLDIYAHATVLLEDRVAPREGDRAVRQLRVRDDDPELALDVVPLEGGGFELRPHGRVRLVGAGGRAIAWDGDALYRCTDALSGGAELLSGVFAGAGERLTLAGRDAAAFAAVALPRLEELVAVEVPAAMEELRPARCELEFYLDRTREGVTCAAYAAYGDRRFDLMARGGHPARDAGGRDAVPMRDSGLVRDVRAEARGREALRRYFGMDEAGELRIPAARPDALAALAYEGVVELGRIGKVFTTDAFDRTRSKARPRVRVGLSVRSNLLSLTLRTEGVDGSELAGLLESYRLRRRYHELRDGSFVDMRATDLARASAIVDELGVTDRQVAAGGARLPAYRALLLDDVAAGAASDETLDDYLDRIHSVDLGAYEPPASLARTLRGYQRTGYQWLCGLAELGMGGVLADEMGLGKSVQLIAFLLAHAREARRDGPSLVVCPASLVYNWHAEFEKFAPELVVRVVAGSAEERRALRSEPGADVLVTSYDLLRRDVDDYARMDLWCMALDEAQYIKNHDTLVAKAVKAPSARHRLALTGTPVENRLSELWSIFDFLMPGFLGSYDRFRERYERPAVEGDEEVTKRLRAAIRPFVLRRTKREVLGDLPEKIEQVVYARMGSAQRGVYAAQVAELRTQLADDRGMEQGGRMQVLAALTRLRQICCDPALVFEGYDEGACKVDTIMTLVERVVDAHEKMLVFSQFTSFLDVIARRLDERGIPFCTITGRTPKRRRLELVNQFNADETPVFLISLKAGGTGLNLTGASVVLHADPWWNVAAQNQATDRAHRMGQTRDVTVYQVICKGTIEERILELQRTKAQLADAVVAGDSAGISLANLSREELDDLLG